MASNAVIATIVILALLVVVILLAWGVSNTTAEGQKERQRIGSLNCTEILEYIISTNVAGRSAETQYAAQQFALKDCLAEVRDR